MVVGVAVFISKALGLCGVALYTSTGLHGCMSMYLYLSLRHLSHPMPDDLTALLSHIMPRNIHEAIPLGASAG